MIEIKNLTKKFSEVCALDSACCSFSEGEVWGLTGSNGAGKSTMLRILAGVLSPDEGEVLIDGDEVFNNAGLKKRCFFVPDYPFFYSNSTADNMAELYAGVYPKWNAKVFVEFCEQFEINRKQSIVRMSKGMQRQVALSLAFASQADYMFLDEIFDGLDPVVRQRIKKHIVEAVMDRNMTCVIASHNLRELDDICDNIIMLHKGVVQKNERLDALKNRVHRIQVAFHGKPEVDFLAGLDVSDVQNNGSYYNFVVRGEFDVMEEKIKSFDPVFFEVIPCSLEEIFIGEMGEHGYEV